MSKNPGYIYAPYITVELPPEIKKDISSRFGTKMLNNKFYGYMTQKIIRWYNLKQFIKRIR